MIGQDESNTADSTAGLTAPATWSADDTGSHTVDRMLSRELVRAGLFDGRSAPRIGRFVVAERLGAGASSVVYAAWDEHLARRVAVKVFVAESSATRLQVQREARALAQLSHRNVVAVFEVGEWNDHAFIAMELVLGTTLAHWQAKPERTTAELLDAYLQAGRGLSAAHQAGLVHRDFKPANVMVAGDGRVVVTDFGLVGGVAPDPAAPGPGGAAEDMALTTRSLVGTPAYVAPEQRSGAIPHPSADLYSFALCLCEALIGWHPRCHPERAWEHALARRVPARLRAAIRVGLAEAPGARGASLDGLLDALTPPRPRTAGRRAAIAGLAIGATAFARVVAWYLPHDVPPTDTLPPVVTMFHAPSHRSLADRIDRIVAAPPPRDEAGALTELRSLVLEPLPRELACAWPAPPIAVELGDGFAAGIDREGRVHACRLESGEISLAATGARCMVVEAARIGVLDQAGHPHVVRYVRGGWEPVRIADPVPVVNTQRFEQARCPIHLLPAPDGAASITFTARVVRDRAARITATIEGTEIRIVAGAGPTVLAGRPLPGSPMGSILEVSSDGSRVLAIPQHGPLVWWEASTGRWRQEPLHFDATNGHHARLSPSGTRALLVDAFGRLEVRTLGGGRTAWLTSGPAADAAFGDDDTVFAIDPDARIWRWDLAHQRAGIAAIHYPHLHHDPWVWAVASNAQVMASGSEGGTAMVVDRRGGEARFQAATMADIYTVVLDGDRLVTGGNDGLRMWSWPEGTPLPLDDARGFRTWVIRPATARDGTRAYLAGTQREAKLLLWHDASRTVLHPSGALGPNIFDLAVAADGRTAAAVTSGGGLVLIDVAAERIIAQANLHASGYHVAFDPVTATVVTAGGDGYLRTWSADDGTPRWGRQISASAIYGLDVHAGRAVTASSDGRVELTDLATGQVVRTYRGHPAAALTARFRNDGAWFVTGDENGRACLWRVDEDECHTWLDGHTKGVIAATFAEDGTIYTGGKDGTVRFWRPTYDAPAEALLAELAQYGSRR